MFEEIINKKEKISVVGLGYVGLPIALEFARKFPVIGFDIKEDRVEMMREHKDPSQELEPSAFDGADILFTSDPADLKQAGFHIVAVPTPIDEYHQPDLRPLLAATKTVGQNIKKGDYIVFESTVYPGCTEEECIPLLEETSGLVFNKDFKVGFSPERINPGDKVNTLTTIKKVVSGSDEESLKNISQVYGTIIKAGIHEASSIKVAEAAKIIENTQRDINIAFMNELSILFGKMDINTYEVLEAAGTKWNFLNFFPGLVGGHCIGVDPYYLTYKAKKIGYHAQIINSGRFVNDSMGGYIAKQTVKKMLSNDVNLQGAKVLMMGATFKENVSDIRNSKVVDIIRELESFGVQVDTMDPYADKNEFREEYGLELKDKNGSQYNAIIVAVSHKEYISLDESYFAKLLKPGGILVDIKGIYLGKINKLPYWSL